MFESLFYYGTSLWGLFATSFVAATLLPAGSEALLSVMVVDQRYAISALVMTATIGNTLGGLLTYAMGYAAQGCKKELLPKQSSGIERVRKYGVICLLFSWLPIIGDVLCFAAGWLKLNFFWSSTLLLLGKLIRYWVIALLAQGVFN